MANSEVADMTDRYLEPYFKDNPCTCIMECNPGVGLFTRKLLDREEQFRKIILMEPNSYFINNLQEIHNVYPDRVQVKQGDLANLWKMIYQDKVSGSSKVKELLRDIPVQEFQNEPNMIVFGLIGSIQFYKNLIYNLAYGAGLFAYGRPEMYLIVPPPIYLRFTCTKEFGYVLYRSSSILFQIMFEYRFIGLLPRGHFLPIQSDIVIDKKSRLKKVNLIHHEYMYLVRIIPRRNLYNLCAAEDLPALIYFVSQNCNSRYNRIIPTLEKFVPGCGPRLLIRSKRYQNTRQFYLDEDVENIPPYSTPCTTMSTRDYPDINIYSIFGDLSASQILTLFREFRSWPEYGDSAFMASFENTLLKRETSDLSVDNSLNMHNFINTNHEQEHQEEEQDQDQSNEDKVKANK